MLDRINSSMPLKHLLIKWAGTLSKAKHGYGFSRASEMLKHKTTVNTKGKRGGQWCIHEHHRRSEDLENAEANRTRAACSPNGNCTCSQRLCVRAGAWTSPSLRLGGREWVGTVGGSKTERNSCNQFSSPKFLGWVKKLGELFNINVSLHVYFTTWRWFCVIIKKKKACAKLCVPAANSATSWIFQNDYYLDLLDGYY